MYMAFSWTKHKPRMTQYSDREIHHIHLQPKKMWHFSKSYENSFHLGQTIVRCVKFCQPLWKSIINLGNSYWLRLHLLKRHPFKTRTLQTTTMGSRLISTWWWRNICRSIGLLVQYEVITQRFLWIEEISCCLSVCFNGQKISEKIIENCALQQEDT